ncbi:unnamed protein product [Penicillium nalgiovense]|nr:unnamed protein product [Penicillium nalgiovense]CAG8143141.1 unnamed protein product [Penicillium nalgiovense]CAG8200422.1 unnamed protein product [Penicillium nalgiovense]
MTNAITDLYAIVDGSSPAPPLKHPCGESYRRIGLRRVLRVFCPRPHRLHTMNGGVFEPLAVRIARSYPITTVQFIVTDGFVTCLWLSQVARCVQRGFSEATAGDCDDLDTTSCQYRMNGDCIDEGNCHVLMRLRDTPSKFQWAYTTVCLSAFEHRERIALVDWVTGVQWVAPRYSRMASGVFLSLIIRQAPRNADVSRCLMAGEPTFTIGHVVSPKPRARRRRGKTPFVSDLGANFGHTSYEQRRQDRLYRDTAEPTKEPKIPSDTVPSDPTPHCSGVRHIRTSGNEPSGNIRNYQVGIRNVSVGTDVW